jgi:hypothetical protein
VRVRSAADMPARHPKYSQSLMALTLWKVACRTPRIPGSSVPPPVTKRLKAVLSDELRYLDKLREFNRPTLRVRRPSLREIAGSSAGLLPSSGSAIIIALVFGGARAYPRAVE